MNRQNNRPAARGLQNDQARGQASELGRQGRDARVVVGDLPDGAGRPDGDIEGGLADIDADEGGGRGHGSVLLGDGCGPLAGPALPDAGLLTQATVRAVEGNGHDDLRYQPASWTKGATVWRARWTDGPQI